MEQLLLPAPQPPPSDPEVIFADIIEIGQARFRDGSFEVIADAETVKILVLEYLRNQRIQERYRFFRLPTRAGLGIATLLLVHKYKIPATVAKTATAFFEFLSGV